MCENSSAKVPEAPGTSDGSMTAVDYLETQLKLEKEAREAMPYEPDKCTYPQALRQLVFACLTCRRENSNADIGVCYSCSIQCHSTHELVELFSKRDFVCDCGTARMKLGKACTIRTRQAGEVSDASVQTVPRMRTGSFSSTTSRHFSSLELPSATDIESSGNVYNQNFAGKFCDCDVPYNPIKETQTMHQCYLGDACGEDWFHQECILGYHPGTFSKGLFTGSGENKLDDLPPPGIDAASETVAKLAEEAAISKDEEDEKVPHFPDLESFGEFVCWKCVSMHRDAFDELSTHSDVVVAKRSHFENVASAEIWSSLNESTDAGTEPPAKRQKTKSVTPEKPASYSVFLIEDAYKPLSSLRDSLSPSSPLRELLENFNFLTKEHPIYQPEEEDVASTQASEGSLYDLGSSALSSLPIPQALEGLQAYDNMKEKLRGFFKDFVDQQKVVTEEEVRTFFGRMKKE